VLPPPLGPSIGTAVAVVSIRPCRTLERRHSPSPHRHGSRCTAVHPPGARVDGATRRRHLSVRLRRVALAGGGDGRRAGSVARSRSVSARSLPRGH